VHQTQLLVSAAMPCSLVVASRLVLAVPSQLRVVTSPVAAISSAIRTAAGVMGPAPVDTTICSVAVVLAKPWI
jgi:hypothetical protein